MLTREKKADGECIGVNGCPMPYEVIGVEEFEPFFNRDFFKFLNIRRCLNL